MLIYFIMDNGVIENYNWDHVIINSKKNPTKYLFFRRLFMTHCNIFWNNFIH